ncbi:hypothetical protein EUTSA_v10003106mg [Eutrema salsugineum]|uniref:DUF4283 domain-containing protein n=1 Tax=Eutrema salsugineum TaxID=72664 RepID=V4MY95_EUTSA|nr:hypothetical protein EUTSA_v10003106mg [Eutrema salsugineum]
MSGNRKRVSVSTLIVMVLMLSASQVTKGNKDVALAPVSENGLLPNPISCIGDARKVPDCVKVLKKLQLRNIKKECCIVLFGIPEDCFGILFPASFAYRVVLKMTCKLIGIGGFRSTSTLSPPGILLALYASMSRRYSREEKGKDLASSHRWIRDPPIRLPDESNPDLIEANRLTLIGWVLNPNVQKTKALISFMPQVWRMEENIVGKDLGTEKFHFKFRSEEDLQAVLNEATFHFK